MLTSTLALIAFSASTVLAFPRHGIVDHNLPRDFYYKAWPGNAGPWKSRPRNSQVATTTAAAAEVTVSPLPASDFDQGRNFQSPTEPTTTPCCRSTSTGTFVTTNTVTVISNTGVPGSTTPAVASASINPTTPVAAGAFYGSRSSNVPQQPSSVANTPSAPGASTTMETSTRPAAPASSSSNAPSTGGSNAVGKKGISYNSAARVAAFGKSVSWAYNWASTPDGNLNGVQYVPMAWGLNDVSSIASKVGSATHVLSFNEPDLNTQSNIDPVTAAKQHIAAFSSLRGKVQIGSPAVTNGATTSPPMGTNWLDQFFTACGANCPVDFVAYHWYATADSFDYFKTHTQNIINTAAKYGVKKVWLTEFAPEGSAEAQAAFMKLAVPFLDATPAVERYAAFMAADGQLMAGGSLNTVGSAYASAS